MTLPSPDPETLQRLYLRERRSMKSIASTYGVSPTTVMRWLRKAEIPTRPAHPVFVFRMIDGVKQKQCKGPLHREGVWLPLESFKWKKEKIRPQCRDCERFHNNVERLIDFKEPLTGILAGIVHRVGIIEAARRLGVSQPTIAKLYRSQRAEGGRWGKSQRLQIRKSTAEKILRTMHELRQTGEVRHRDSIKHGASQRGRTEKEISTRKDFYYQTGDLENAQHRKHRATRKSAG